MSRIHFFESSTISSKFHAKTRIVAFSDTKADEKEWPASWKKVHYKTYPRFPKIILPHNQGAVMQQFVSLLMSRSSQRDFKKNSINLSQLSTLLFYSAGIIPSKVSWDEKRRFYPSAGARYPLELYPMVMKIKGLKQGIYHYNVKESVLEVLLKEKALATIMEEITSQEWVRSSAVVLAISGIFNRTQIKYGDRGYRYLLLEAGHMAQNIYLLSAALGLKCCAVGGYLDDKINQLIDFDDQQEAVLYVLSLGS